MPIYKYKCIECKSLMEAMVSIDDRDIPAPCINKGCPGKLKRQLSLPSNVEYKGSRIPNVEIIDERGQ